MPVTVATMATVPTAVMSAPMAAVAMIVSATVVIIVPTVVAGRPAEAEADGQGGPIVVVVRVVVVDDAGGALDVDYFGFTDHMSFRGRWGGRTGGPFDRLRVTLRVRRGLGTKERVAEGGGLAVGVLVGDDDAVGQFVDPEDRQAVDLRVLHQLGSLRQEAEVDVVIDDGEFRRSSAAGGGEKEEGRRKN